MYQGDNLGAFGQYCIVVNLSNPDEKTISKASFVLNNTVIREVENPVFPYNLDLNEKESMCLREYNILQLIVYDEDNKKLTLPKTCTFQAKPRVDIKEGIYCG